ncbi:MAG: rhamnulokinase [Eubacteriales bacterium]
MSQYYLAVDIGASSGRHILGWVEDGIMKLEEIYRFENGMQQVGEHLCWDTKGLFNEIKNGLKKCKEIGKIPVGMGIDTWAVDYVLMDGNNEILGNTYAYRDGRTKGMDEEVYQIIPLPDLYAKTGIQKLMFNTIYQLMAAKIQEPEQLEKAETFLMIPDYFNYLLTGNKLQEYTNATSTQLVNAVTNEWDYELIDQLGLKSSLFQSLSMPGTIVGGFTKEIEEEIGFTCEVVLPATHDTGSAVMAVPTLTEECLYISSGTWSLMGIENDKAICTAESMEKNFTNEGGYDYRYRYLKNIMGLWMIQSVRHEINDRYSFAEICKYAEEECDFPTRVDVNDTCFLAPANMTAEIQNYARRTKQEVPVSIGELATVIYQSLAESYAKTKQEIEEISQKKFSSINIVGGGSNAAYLNQLTANKAECIVYAGPGEGTAIGNLMAQMIRSGEFSGLQEARKSVYDSFEVKNYKPEL